MIRWDPARDMVTLRQAMDKLFEQSVIRPPGFFFELGGGSIPVDMYQTESDMVIKAPLPGVKPEEVNISITGDILTIKAETKEDKGIKEKDYIRKENRYGMMTRSITLPVSVDADKAEAKFEHGVLILSLPKSEREKPKQIKVRVGE